MPGRTDLITHHTESGVCRPIKCNLLNGSMKEIVASEIQQMLKCVWGEVIKEFHSS